MERVVQILVLHLNRWRHVLFFFIAAITVHVLYDLLHNLFSLFLTDGDLGILVLVNLVKLMKFFGLIVILFGDEK